MSDAYHVCGAAYATLKALYIAFIIIWKKKPTTRVAVHEIYFIINCTVVQYKHFDFEHIDLDLKIIKIMIKILVNKNE